MDNCLHWFYLCLALCGVLLTALAMFFNYNLKLRHRQLAIEKAEQQTEIRITTLEKKNGKELREIELLQQRVKDLERKLKSYE